MKSKKILIVCRSFFPELTPRSFRATELAKEFALQGHQVTVLLPYDNQRDLSTFENLGIQFKYFGPLVWKDIKPWGKSAIGDLSRKFGRVLNLLLDYPNIEILWRLKPILKKENNYDLLISIAVPHEINWAIAQTRKTGTEIAKTWVADCGDPFMGNILEAIKPPFYFGYFEKLFCKRADFVTVPTQTSLDAYYPEYRHKFRIIPQGFNFDEVKLSNNHEPNLVPTFAYAGKVAQSGIRSLNTLIEKLIETKQPFIFHVYGAEAKLNLKGYADLYPNQIKLHDPLNRHELLFELSKMDFLLNLDNGTLLNTPSKLIDYGLTKRPILNVLAHQPDMDLIKNFFKGDYQNALKIENINQYNIKTITAQILNL